MKKMTKLLCAALAAMLVFSVMAGCSETDKLAAIKKAGKIVMATSPDYAPMEFVDLTKTGQESYVGSDIELGKYIANKLGVTLEIQAMEFNAVQAAVSQGKVDIGISGFSWTEERAEAMILSDFYGDENDFGQGLLVLKANSAQFTSAADFDGKTVAAQNASLQYNLVQKQLPGAVIEPITDLTVAIQMLITGKVDALAVSGDNGQAFTKNYDDITMSEFYFEYDSEGMVIALQKGQQALADAVNEALAEVRQQGLYETWRAEAYLLAESLGVQD